MSNSKKPIVESELLEKFCSSHGLSSGFFETALQHYLPFIQHLLKLDVPRPFVLGVSGSQGSGKSTLADLIAFLARGKGMRVAAFSLDDFYLTHEERKELAEDVHPLLQTRGVPGTHDTEMLANTLDQLASLGDGQALAIPRFDKLADDRMSQDQWSSVVGPVDMVIFEGWCVGAQPQPADALLNPVNDLEAGDDAEAIWRTWVNQQLTEQYQSLWRRIDYFAFLHAPDFTCVLDWREEQEQRLARDSSSDRAPMSTSQLQRFIQHYQRITEFNLDLLPEIADVVFWLNAQHQITETSYRDL